MRIHQITDLHIPDQDQTAEFSHIKPNVLKQLAHIGADNSDLLVISGDLTMRDGSRAACEWLKAALPPHVMTIVIPGNHDDPHVLWEVFGPGRCISPDFCFTLEREHWNLVFLNTASDTLPAEQLQYLSEEVDDSPSILFIHHPPDLVTDGYMARNYPLQNHAEAGDAIRASSIAHVFCGHYHNTAEKECDGFALHLTPSPAFQVDLTTELSVKLNVELAVRVIELSAHSVATRMIDL